MSAGYIYSNLENCPIENQWTMYSKTKIIEYIKRVSQLKEEKRNVKKVKRIKTINPSFRMQNKNKDCLVWCIINFNLYKTSEDT